MDTIKIRLQLQTADYKTYQGVSSTVKQILRNEGIYGFWKGNVPAEIMYILYGAVQFTSYSVLNKVLSELEEKRDFKLNRSFHSLVIGSGAGISSTFVTYPFDLLRTRLAANTQGFLSLTSTITNIYHHDGFRGFFIGMNPAILSVASTTGLMFWSYDIARTYSTKYQNIPFIEGICGFFAGATAKGITFPLDTLRKRVQMKKHNTSSIIPITATILRNEGLFGLYKGFGISVLKTAPTSAISLFIYEYSITQLRS